MAECALMLNAVQFREAFAIEPKTTGYRFHSNNVPVEHHFDTMSYFLTEQQDSYCKCHKSYSCKGLVRNALGHGVIDLAVIGFPCAPYSTQRSSKDKCSGGEITHMPNYVALEDFSFVFVTTSLVFSVPHVALTWAVSTWCGNAGKFNDFVSLVALCNCLGKCMNHEFASYAMRWSITGRWDFYQLLELSVFQACAFVG
eukprot:5977982-Amphidinium_carterae.6